jgi:hypothetical protein
MRYLDDALSKLEAEDPVKARLVELRFFAGLSNEQAAEQLGIATATATRYWAFSRAWLKTRFPRRLQGQIAATSRAMRDQL